MRNEEVVEIYLRLKQDRELLIQELIAGGMNDRKVLLPAVTKWIRNFRYRWKSSHGKKKFNEKYRSWLDETFTVRYFTVEYLHPVFSLLCIEDFCCLLYNF